MKLDDMQVGGVARALDLMVSEAIRKKLEPMLSHF